jgi:hypothetical protein
MLLPLFSLFDSLVLLLDHRLAVGEKPAPATLLKRRSRSWRGRVIDDDVLAVSDKVVAPSNCWEGEPIDVDSVDPRAAVR